MQRSVLGALASLPVLCHVTPDDLLGSSKVTEREAKVYAFMMDDHRDDDESW